MLRHEGYFWNNVAMEGSRKGGKEYVYEGEEDGGADRSWRKVE